MEGIKSKDRVKEHGEVFTPDSIVNDMLNLVDEQTKGLDIKQKIDFTYLEPACGNGNFLIRILDRKLGLVKQLPENEQELWLLHAIASIYAVDIQRDNVIESIDRMTEVIKNGCTDTLELDGKTIKSWATQGFNLDETLEKNVKCILNRNIMHGNALSGRQVDSDWKDKEDSPLMITEYNWCDDNITLKEITFNSLKEDIPDMYSIEKLYNTVNYKDIYKATEVITSDDSSDEYDF